MKKQNKKKKTKERVTRVEEKKIERKKKLRYIGTNIEMMMLRCFSVNLIRH